MPWPKTGSTYYHAQLGLTDKDREIKGDWLTVIVEMLMPWHLQ